MYICTVHLYVHNYVQYPVPLYVHMYIRTVHLYVHMYSTSVCTYVQYLCMYICTVHLYVHMQCCSLTVNRVLLGQSPWDATWDAVAYSWGRKVNFEWKLGLFIMTSVNHTVLPETKWQLQHFIVYFYINVELASKTSHVRLWGKGLSVIEPPSEI